MIIERLNTGQEGVADWFYDFFEAESEGVQVSTIELKLECFDTLLKILKKYKLFAVKELNLIYTRNRLERKILLTPEESENFKINEFIKINLDSIGDFITLECYGTSFIGQEEEKGAFTIIFSLAHMMIITDSDAWLRLGLDGNLQEEIYKLNAPRLKAALEEIEEKLGFEPVYDHSKYAYVNKYELINVNDDEGFH